MHISYTGVRDALSYAPAKKRRPEHSILWACLAVVVPLTLLYAIVALASAIAMAASGLDASWFPVG